MGLTGDETEYLLSRLDMVVDPKKRIVGSMPLTVIWNHDGELNAERVRNLSVDDIKSMLRQGAVQFVVANVGSPLDWIHPDLSFDFWRKLAKQRIVSADADGFSLDDFPGGYCYFAGLWRTPDAGDIIVLETHH